MPDRRAALYVDKILKGAKQARRPSGRTTHEVRTSDQPQDGQGTRPRLSHATLLARADEVIE